MFGQKLQWVVISLSALVSNLSQPIEVSAQTFSHPLPSETFEIKDGATTTCTVTNVKQGTLVINKNTIGGDKGALFDYNITLEKTNLPYPSTQNKNLTVKADILLPSSPNSYTGHEKIYLDPGDYKISEKARDGDHWTFKKASCTSSVTPPPPTPPPPTPPPPTPPPPTPPPPTPPPSPTTTTTGPPLSSSSVGASTADGVENVTIPP